MYSLSWDFGKKINKYVINLSSCPYLVEILGQGDFFMHEILKNLPLDIRSAVQRLSCDLTRVNEIRLRVGQKLVVYVQNKEIWIDIVINKKHINELMEFATRHSVYAYENQIKQGYITVTGGHRIGICGKAIVVNGELAGFRNISSVNIRIAHEIKGCGNRILHYIYDKDRLYNTLIIAPPGCGKTTVLRDIIRQLSAYCNVGVCDERGELGACFDGICNNDLGSRTDIIEGCDKLTATDILLRTMTPAIIAMDELGSRDYPIIGTLGGRGCRAIATIHGSSVAELSDEIIDSFEHFIILSKICGIGTLDKVYAKAGRGERDSENNSDYIRGLVLLFDRAELL